MGDESFDDGRSAGRVVSEDVDHSVVEAGIAEDGADEAMGRGTNFGGFEDDGVAAGERDGDGADSENDRSVPGRDAKNDADRLTDGEGEAARNFGGE